MALFGTIGPAIAQGLTGLGGLFGGPIGGLAQFGGSILSGLTQPSARLPVLAGGPVVAMPVAERQPPIIATERGGRVMGTLRGVTAAVQPILIKMAGFLARRSITLRAAITLISRLGKFMAPAAVAGAVGLSVAELADLIIASKAVRRRRTNPANVRALRRAMRRIESFHKLCVRADLLRTRGRKRSPRGASCAK